MSVLTKVFVVLVNVLSVALVALVIAFVANTENYHEKWEQAQKAKLGAETTARMAEQERARAKEDFDAQSAKLSAELRQQMQLVEGLQQDLAQAQADLVKERTNSAAQSADVTRLSASLNQSQALLTTTLQELEQRRQEVASLQTKAIQLTDRNNELASQTDALNRQIRRINEQSTTLEQEKSRLEDVLAKVPADIRQNILGGAAPAGAATTFVAPPPGIRGQIVKLQESAGQTFAEVNVGKSDKVAPNMKFMVHRGNKFLGNLVIISVDDRAAAGRLELLQGAVAVGDNVQSGSF